MSLPNYEHHENLRISFENQENHENHRIPYENYENNKNLRFQNEIIIKIIKIVEFHERLTKIMKI